MIRGEKMKEKNARGYLSFFKLMRKLMGEEAVEDVIMRIDTEGRADISGIATEGKPFDDSWSWCYWYSLAMLVPLLHGDVQDHPEKYEEGVSAHVLVLEQLRARLDAWRYGYLDFESVKRCVPDDEPERQRAALDFAIRAFEVWLENWDQS